MLNKEYIFLLLNQEKPYLKDRYGVIKIALFGSFAKDKQKKKSDIDLLVELSRPLGFEFVELIEYLEKVLGKRVDIATFETFKRSLENPRYKHIAQNIQRTLIYV